MAARDPQEADLLCLLRVYAGDVEALAELYDRHTPVLHAVAMAVSGSARDADEFVHRTWMTVWNRSRLYDRRSGPVANWLLELTRREAVEALRERPRRQEAEELVGGVRRAPPPAPESAAAGAVRALPALERQALEGAFFKGMHATRLAAHLEVEPRVARELLRRGLEGLLRPAPVREPA